MAGLDPAIHDFLVLKTVRRGCPGHLARRRASRFCPGMTIFTCIELNPYEFFSPDISGPNNSQLSPLNFII